MNPSRVGHVAEAKFVDGRRYCTAANDGVWGRATWGGARSQHGGGGEEVVLRRAVSSAGGPPCGRARVWMTLGAARARAAGRLRRAEGGRWAVRGPGGAVALARALPRCVRVAAAGDGDAGGGAARAARGRAARSRDGSGGGA